MSTHPTVPALPSGFDAEAWLAAIVASSDDGIVSKTLDGVITSWNEGAERIFGYAAAEIVGRPMATLIPPDRLHEEAEILAKLRRGERIDHFETVRQRRDGGLVEVSVTISPMRDRTGRVVGASKIIRDIAQQKRVERALRVAQAAAEAARVEAEQARASAEAASRAKGEFLACMSHEIRTPLNGVVGMLQLLAGSPLDAGQRRQVDAARSSAATLLSLINDILDFSKIEAGKLELDPVPFDVAQAAGEAAAVVRPQAQAKGLRLACHVDPRLNSCRFGPADRVRQVLVNLLGNAVKFTAAGSVTLTITAEGEGDGVRFDVADTGIGIPPDRLGRLFRSFSQVDGSTTRKYGGTGLGLAICRQLAGLMGGSVSVASEPGRGSTFTFIAQLPGNQQCVEPIDVPFDEPFAPGIYRVLVAEDNEVNQMVVGQMLARMGVAHDVVGEGRAAVGAVLRGGYDLVLMDCQMPGEDGFGATAAIRAAESSAGGGHRLPVIALTADALKGDRERCLDAGMDDYLSKPIDSAQLREMLARWLTPLPRRSAAA